MLKIEKFTDVCMTGGMHYTPCHTNVSKFYNFQVTFLKKECQMFVYSGHALSYTS